MPRDLLKACETSVPDEAPIRNTLPRADYEDAFVRVLPELSPDESAKDLFERMFKDISPFFLVPKRLKEALLSPLGFSSVDLEQFEWQDLGPNERVGIFVNQPFTAHIGLSINRRDKRVVLSSRVVFHNFLGKSYMAVFKPIHRTVFKFLLNRL